MADVELISPEWLPHPWISEMRITRILDRLAVDLVLVRVSCLMGPKRDVKRLPCKGTIREMWQFGMDP